MSIVIASYVLAAIGAAILSQLKWLGWGIRIVCMALSAWFFILAIGAIAIWFLALILQ